MRGNKKTALQVRQYPQGQSAAGAVNHSQVHNTTAFRRKERLMFKIIDKNLGLASCSISDLTMDQAHDFLSKWEEGATIGTLTLFYDENRSMVVLNEDHVNYDFYLETVPAFMSLSEASRKEFLDKAPDSEKETFKVLNSAMERMGYRKDLDRLKRQNIPFLRIDALNYIRNKEKDHVAFMFAFMYGVMCGKREERARKKAGAAV